jgi:guanyl-specific ribonuclease Sa
VDPLVVVLVLLAVALTVAVLSAPLRARHAEREDAAHAARVADLEAAKEARYREIREAEMDYRTGKLSEADWKAVDRQLRAEAVELLRRLDQAGAPAPSPSEGPREHA